MHLPVAVTGNLSRNVDLYSRMIYSRLFPVPVTVRAPVRPRPPAFNQSFIGAVAADIVDMLY